MPILNMVYYAAEWGGWWQPWANTVAYYPLKENLNDIVGTHNMTNSGITFSDGFAVLNWNQRPTVPSVTWWKTLAFWFKKTNDANWMIITQWNTDGYIQLRTNGFAAAWTWWWSFNADFTAWWSTPSNVWRCCVVSQNVANNSWAGSWSMKFYLSDFWWVSWIRQYDTTAHYLNWSIADFWWSGNASFPYALISNVSRFVVDGDEWSLSDCEDFYNLTKADYGY